MPFRYRDGAAEQRVERKELKYVPLAFSIYLNLWPLRRLVQ